MLSCGVSVNVERQKKGTIGKGGQKAMLHFNFRSGKKEKSAKEYRECAAMHMNAVKSSVGTFLQTGVVIVATVVVMVALGRAWFVSNSRVEGAAATISADGSNKFSIATLASSESDKQGIYDVNAQGSPVSETPLAKALNKFFRADKNGRDDDDGNHYTSFVNLPNLIKGTTVFTDKKGQTYILGDSDGISLMVNAESNVNNTEEFEHVGPGSYGKFTFYIIPHIDDLEQVKLSVSLSPFTLEREGDAADKRATGSAKIVGNNKENEVLLNMLQGHILLFTGKDNESGNYKNRILSNLEDDGRISFKFEKNCDTTTWVKDQAEPVTIYWIWPKRFENIKYCGQEDSVFKSICQSHEDLMNWINENREKVVNTNIVQDTSMLQNPTEDMTNQQFAQWNTGYNKGDQLIGDNIAFFHWVIEAE